MNDSDTTDGESDPVDRINRRALKNGIAMSLSRFDKKRRGHVHKSWSCRKAGGSRLEDDSRHDPTIWSSPVRTNRIPRLPDSENTDTVSLLEILSSSLTETWQSVAPHLSSEHTRAH